MIKRIAAAVICTYFCFYAATANQANPRKPEKLDGDILLFRQAKNSFREEDYGKALKYADEAQIARKKIIDWELYTLKNAMKSPEVRKKGDVLSDVKAAIEKRQDYDASEIINKYSEDKPDSFFSDSVEKLMSYISAKNTFPEAELMEGNIYQLDGEYEIAKKYLYSAWKHAENFDIPGEKYNVLYSLADIAEIQKDDDNYEKNLLLILADDSYFRKQDMNDAMMLIIRNGKKGSMEKFFNLFRSDDYRSLEAYCRLGVFYKDKGEKDKALKAASLASLAGFTKMYNAVRQRDPEFEYSGTASLFEEIKRYGDITDWAEEKKVWEEFIFFGDAAAEDGDISFASELYTVLSEHAPEEYWKKEASEKKKQLENAVPSSVIQTDAE
jgi:hypothetical protein